MCSWLCAWLSGYVAGCVAGWVAGWLAGWLAHLLVQDGQAASMIYAARSHVLNPKIYRVIF